jgi:acetate---CoA ligase (ADP-forming)
LNNVEAVARFLRPQSVAIVGMSARKGSTGQVILQSLKLNEFAGPIHLIGRSTEPIDGRPVLQSPDELPEGVDLAVFVLPAAAVRDAIAACVRRKVGSAIVFASGFAELGGRDEQDAIAQMARDGGLAVVGPNCLGFTNNVDGFEVHLLFARPVQRFTADSKPGVAFIGQSGGLLGHFQRAAGGREMPVSYVVSIGNEAGLDATDFIEFLAQDRATNCIALYAEQIQRPAAFLQACARARAAGKTIVMLHPGRSSNARAAAQSHTGSLAGDYATMRTHVERGGVLVVETIDELLDVSEVLTRFPVPPEKGPGILSASGAICAIVNDVAEALDFDIPVLEPSTVKRLTELLPAFNTYRNPLDVTTACPAENMPHVTRALLDDPNVGMLLISAASGLPVDKMNEGMMGSEKPAILVLLGDGSPLMPHIAEAVKVTPAVFSRSTDRSLRAVANYTRYGRALAAARKRVIHARLTNLPPIGRGPQAEWFGKRILAAAGIRVPAGELARSANEAVSVAERVGFPVALKAQAAALAHKTEAGGVMLNIADAAALRAAWETMMRNLAQVAPGIVLDGGLVERMSPRGLELVVGAKRDPAWGTVLVLGLGGIWVEAIGDVQFLPGDASEEEIVGGLRRLRSAKLLDGFRGAPPADVAAVAQAVTAIARLMVTVPEILEIDVNPLMVHAAGEGVTALDALVVTA